MIGRRIVGLVLMLSTFWMAGVPSQAAAARASNFDKCIDVCNKQDHVCRFGGTNFLNCQSKLHVCDDSCARTGRPISFGLLR